VECDLPPEDDPEEDLAGGDASAAQSLPHLDWFDSVSYEALRDWVPTMGTVPQGAVHAVARLKGAVLQGGLEAKARGDTQGYICAWKAITFMDRLLLLTCRDAGKAEGGTPRLKW